MIAPALVLQDGLERFVTPLHQTLLVLQESMERPGGRGYWVTSCFFAGYAVAVQNLVLNCRLTTT